MSRQRLADRLHLGERPRPDGVEGVDLDEVRYFQGRTGTGLKY